MSRVRRAFNRPRRGGPPTHQWRSQRRLDLDGLGRQEASGSWFGCILQTCRGVHTMATRIATYDHNRRCVARSACSRLLRPRTEAVAFHAFLAALNAFTGLEISARVGDARQCRI